MYIICTTKSVKPTTKIFYFFLFFKRDQTIAFSSKELKKDLKSFGI